MAQRSSHANARVRAAKLRDDPTWVEEPYRCCRGCGFKFPGEEVDKQYSLCSNCRPLVIGAVPAVDRRTGGERPSLPRCMRIVDHSGRVGR